MWSGEQCFDQCAPGCKQCSQFNTSSCGTCHNERHGESCEKNCSSGCISNNQSQICDTISGVYELGCINGVWSEICENSSGNGCTGGHCNRSNGYCLNSCIVNYFGGMCDELCSDNCIATAYNSSLRSCDEENGHCLYDCRSGWFSERCSEECSKNCKDVECYRDNGSCIYGCIGGYTGLGCRQGSIYVLFILRWQCVVVQIIDRTKMDLCRICNIHVLKVSNGYTFITLYENNN